MNERMNGVIDRSSTPEEYAADIWRRAAGAALCAVLEGNERATVPSRGPFKQGINSFATGHAAG